MKVKVLLLVCILLASVVAVQASIIRAERVMAQYSGFNIYTHSITDTGVVVRVRFRILARHEDGTRSWHYFGVTEAELPPEIYTDSPLTEYTYVQFPDAFNDLPVGGEYESALYDLGVSAGLYREGLKAGP